MTGHYYSDGNASGAREFCRLGSRRNSRLATCATPGGQGSAWGESRKRGKLKAEIQSASGGEDAEGDVAILDLDLAHDLDQFQPGIETQELPESGWRSCA